MIKKVIRKRPDSAIATFLAIEVFSNPLIEIVLLVPSKFNLVLTIAQGMPLLFRGNLERF
jgi:hypothetical protein